MVRMHSRAPRRYAPWRDWRRAPPTTPPPPTCRFAVKLQETEAAELKPVYHDDGVNYVFVQHNNIYIMALTKTNSNVTAIFVFLEHLMSVMGEYFGTLEEESIRCVSRAGGAE